MFTRLFQTSLASCIATYIVFLSISVATAQVMQSSSYRIQSDSVNFGGGLSTSTNYSLESTGGEIATGESSSGSYNLFAGYQQMQSVYIAITGVTPVTLSPSIVGIVGGNAFGSTTVTVTTDSASGYTLTIEAESTPAMQKGADVINDYTPVTADPDFTFTTDGDDVHLGFSPEGVDVVQRFLDDGGSCNAGSSDTLLRCWDGLSTTAEMIASAGSANHPNGATTTIEFQVGIGNAAVVPAGDYIATTTVTALPL